MLFLACQLANGNVEIDLLIFPNPETPCRCRDTKPRSHEKKKKSCLRRGSEQGKADRPPSPVVLERVQRRGKIDDNHGDPPTADTIFFVSFRFVSSRSFEA